MVKSSINFAIFTEMHHYTYHKQSLIFHWNLSNLKTPSTSLYVSWLLTQYLALEKIIIKKL